MNARKLSLAVAAAAVLAAALPASASASGSAAGDGWPPCDIANFVAEQATGGPILLC